MGGLVPLKGGFCGLDVNSLLIPNDFQVLLVGGWDSFMTMNPGPSQQHMNEVRVLMIWKQFVVPIGPTVRSRLMKPIVQVELPSKSDTSIAASCIYLKKLRLPRTYKEIIFREDLGSTNVHVSWMSRVVAITYNGLLWCLRTSCLLFLLMTIHSL